MPCAASGSPQPKITNWLINNRRVNFNTNFLLSTGSLRIDKITRNDSGDYQCVASNNVGGVVSEKRKVIVACELQFLEIAIILAISIILFPFRKEKVREGFKTLFKADVLV